ncbi:MAG: prepilin peptidase [Candidatus Bathyarchaeota archaeon]|nr:prepilin peptidase [Candidatus Bathyarchaeota archaeon]
MQEVFAAARVAVSVVFLLYASWSDYKERMVSDRVWVVYAPLAAALVLPELVLYDPSRLLWFGLSAAVTVGIAVTLFYSGSFGGADSKAFMCIALALPFYPQTLLTPLIPQGVSPLAQTVFPIAILSNSVLIAAASGIYMLLRNIANHTEKTPMFEGTLKEESVFKKLLVLVTGQKVLVSTLEAKWHVYPLEDINTKGDVEKRSLVVMPDDEAREAIVKRLSDAAQAGRIKSRVWATPGLPMLIFVTAGLLLALVFGDLIWIFITHVLG